MTVYALSTEDPYWLCRSFHVSEFSIALTMLFWWEYLNMCYYLGNLRNLPKLFRLVLVRVGAHSASMDSSGRLETKSMRNQVFK